MTILEKTVELRAKTGFDHDKDIRDTLENPQDFYRAVEYGIRTMCKKAKISLKSVFVPFVNASKYFTLNLANSGVPDFEIIAPKAIYVLTSDGSTIEITQEEIEDVITNTYNMDLSIYRTAFRKFTDTTRLQSNFEVNSQPAVGAYDTISNISGADVTTTTGSTIGYYAVNLSKADEGIYSYRRITGVAGTVNTMDSTVASIWTIGDKIYFVNGLPYLFTILFQGLPKSRYFDSYSTIPIDDMYLEYIDNFALEYLYEIIKARFPEHTQTWLAYVAKGKDSIKDIKALAAMRTAFTKVNKHIPYSQDYGR